MGIGAELISILKETVKLADSVERLNGVNAALQTKVEDINTRVTRLEARIDTYVEIAQSQRLPKE